MWRGWRCLCWSLVLAALGFGASAQSPTAGPESPLIVVSSDTSMPYAETIKALVEQWTQAGFSRQDIRTMTLLELSSAIKAGRVPRPRVFVALGVEASLALAQSSVQAPVLSALIPRSGFARVLRLAELKASSNFTALYLDLPLGRQLALIALALPKARRMGVLLGPESGARLPMLKTAAAANGLTVVDARIESTQDLFPALKQVLAESDVLLAMADPEVFNSNSIQNILLSAFRAKVPMVGFSPAYVRAGALLGLYVTPAQVGRQVANLAIEVVQDKPLPGSPLESRDFEVGVNEPVARAMGLDLKASVLRQDLQDINGSQDKKRLP